MFYCGGKKKQNAVNMLHCRPHERMMMKDGIISSKTLKPAAQKTHACTQISKDNTTVRYAPLLCTCRAWYTWKHAETHTNTHLHPAPPGARNDPVSALPLISKTHFWMMSCSWPHSANAQGAAHVTHQTRARPRKQSHWQGGQRTHK